MRGNSGVGRRGSGVGEKGAEFSASREYPGAGVGEEYLSHWDCAVLGCEGVDECISPTPDPRPPTPEIRGYRDLIAWQEAMELVTEVYALTRNWPREELYGLTSQVRRAAVSVPPNIVEGRGRRSSNEFRKHLSIAYGSLMELETQIQIARNLGYQTDAETNALLARSGRTGRIINALARALPEKRAGIGVPESRVSEDAEEYILSAFSAHDSQPPISNTPPDQPPRGYPALTPDSLPGGIPCA